MEELRDLLAAQEIAVAERCVGLVVVIETGFGDQPAFVHDTAYVFSLRWAIAMSSPTHFAESAGQAQD